MRKTVAVLLTLLTVNTFAQDNPTTQARPIVEEGKRLYKLEMASWYGTDLFLEKYKDRANIGGYFSYTEDGVSKCVFFSKKENPGVIGTISFDSTYNLSTAKTDLTERNFTGNESNIYSIRKLAFAEISSDTMFKQYEGMNFNLIPIIHGEEKKVYVLTGPQESGVVVFGNDYLITFDNNNRLTGKKQLHQNLIITRYGAKAEKGKEIMGTMHSHLPETGDFITATDICTLMLYEKFAKWQQHNVVSEKYLNIWNCLTDKLTVIPLPK